MALRAVQSRSLADQVFEQIAGEILVGRYAPGVNLPAERSLVGVFGVNRHVVREALKRLEQIGLVKVSQGGGTQVLDFKRHAGLDLLALMAELARGGEDFVAIWASVLEMRAAIGRDLARLCAQRAPSAIKAELLEVTASMDAASDAELVGLEVRFWNLVVDGAENLAYRLAFNTLIKGATAIPELTTPWVISDVRSNTHRAIVASAIAAGDAERAEAAARVLLTASHDNFLRLVGSTRAPRAAELDLKAVTSPRSPRRRSADEANARPTQKRRPETTES